MPESEKSKEDSCKYATFSSFIQNEEKSTTNWFTGNWLTGNWLTDWFTTPKQPIFENPDDFSEYVNSDTSSHVLFEDGTSCKYVYWDTDDDSIKIIKFGEGEGPFEEMSLDVYEQLRIKMSHEHARYQFRQISQNNVLPDRMIIQIGMKIIIYDQTTHSFKFSKYMSSIQAGYPVGCVNCDECRAELTNNNDGSMLIKGSHFWNAHSPTGNSSTDYCQSCYENL